MDSNAIKTPETHTDELIGAFKLISEIVNGPELSTIKEFIQTTDEARQVDLSNLEQRLESTLAKIREDAMAISADLRHTKADMEADRKKGNEDIAKALDQMKKTRKDMKQNLGETETTLQTNLSNMEKQISKMEEQTETGISDLTREHFQRFTAIESRVTQCENESTARRNENNRLALSLSNAAQSLTTSQADTQFSRDSHTKQVDNILTKLNEDEPDVMDSGSGKSKLSDIGTILHAIDDMPLFQVQHSESGSDSD